MCLLPAGADAADRCGHQSPARRPGRQTHTRWRWSLRPLVSLTRRRRGGVHRIALNGRSSSAGLSYCLGFVTRSSLHGNPGVTRAQRFDGVGETAGTTAYTPLWYGLAGHFDGCRVKTKLPN